MLLWPSDDVRTDDGKEHSGVIYAKLPEDENEQRLFLQNAVGRCSAYAVFVVTRQSKEIVAILESPHGTRTWTLSISRHGDVLVLGKAQKQDDARSLGLLWVPQKGRA